MDEEEYPSEDELVSRAPTPQDLADLCRILNATGTRYIVVGGFAIRGAGYSRETLDLASPRLLYRMKEKTHREKDRADLQFLRENYAEEIFGNGDRG